MKARLKLADGGEKTADAKIIKKDDRTVVYLEKEKFSKDVEYVDFLRRTGFAADAVSSNRRVLAAAF